MANRKQIIGLWGENLAASYLTEKGYRILDRNVYTPYGEIDIIALQECQGERHLIFVEVKTRTSLEFGHPEDAVTKRKQEHLLAAIGSYLQRNSELDYDWQVDVIAIQRLTLGEDPDIQHFENIIS
jgi:putative endonuclease